MSSVRDVLFGQTQRAWITAATQSGKSTLACVFIDEYHKQHADDPIVILDPKQRYYPYRDEDKKTYRLFPAGYRSHVLGRRKGVLIDADIVSDVGDIDGKDYPVHLVQDRTLLLPCLESMYRNSRADTPRLLFGDEVFDVSDLAATQRAFTRLLREGADMGLAVLSISQRPRKIPSEILSEAEHIYVGQLRKWDDRRFLMDELNMPDEDLTILKRVLPPYTWFHVDQIHKRTTLFKLGRSYNE